MTLLVPFCAQAKSTDWVTQPYKVVKGGMPAVGCASNSGDFGVDSMEAVLLAQSNLITQIDTRISQMRKRFTEKRTTANKALSSSIFEQLSTSFAEGALIDARTEKVEYINLNGVDQLCALVVLPNERVKAMISQAMNEPRSDITADNESILYLEFMKAELKSEQ